MAYYVYILSSLKKKWFYVGITNNIQRRLKQHNRGQTQSTKANSPYKLIYLRKFSNRTQARDHEKFLKVKSNKEKVLKTLGVVS